MPFVLQYLARVLPLTYSVDAFRVLMGAGGSVVFEVAVLGLYTILLISLSVHLLKKKRFVFSLITIHLEKPP